MAEQEKEYKDRATEEAQRATQEYEKRYNPSAAAVDAYKRAMTTQLRDSYGQQRETERSYSDLYQQARRQATRQGAMSDISGFGGGRARGREARMSAAEIQALSGIAGQRESALRQLAEQRQAIASNALIEAQQADQYQRAVRAQNIEDMNQVTQLVGNVTDYSKLTPERQRVLKEYGITNQEELNRFLGMAGSAVPAQEQTGISSLGQSVISPALMLPKTLMGLYDILSAQKLGTTARESGLFRDADVGDTFADIGKIFGASEDDRVIKALRDLIKTP